MSILGGLMQAGGYALQAKPKTYDAYGLAAAKFAGEEGRRKGKERQELQRQVAKITQADGGKVLPWQKNTYMERYTGALADAATFQSTGDMLGASKTLTDFSIDSKNYVSNWNLVNNMVKSEGINPIVGQALVGEDPEKVVDVLSKVGSYFGLGINPNTMQLMYSPVQKVNITNAVNSAAQKRLDQIEASQIKAGKTDFNVLTMSPGMKAALAGNMIEDPAIKKHYANLALERNPDLLQMNPQDIDDYITSLGKRDLEARFNQMEFRKDSDGRINIYNQMPGEKEMETMGFGQRKQFRVGSVDVEGFSVLMLGNKTQTLDLNQSNVVDVNGNPIDKTATATVTFDESTVAPVLTRRLTKKDRDAIEKAVALGSADPQMSADFRSVLSKYLTDISNNNERRIVTEAEANALNSIIPNLVSASQVTSGNYKDDDKETKSVRYIGTATRQQYMDKARKADKPLRQEAYRMMDEEWKQMEERIGYKSQQQSAAPKTEAKQTGSGQPKTNWSEKYKVKGIK